MEKSKHNAYLGSYERAILSLKESIRKNNVQIGLSAPRLFFLCGANDSKKEGVLSYRRKFLKNFIESTIENSVVIIAEDFFKSYRANREDNKKNTLDFEFILAEISEKVIIVVESESAFCELGAFSHKTLRKKLIVINDAEYKDVESFINTGPIKALVEEDGCGEDCTIWYKYKEKNDKSNNKDKISTITNKLKLCIEKRKPKIEKNIDIKPIYEGKDKEDPFPSITLEKALFIHDMIYLSSPIKHSDLIKKLTFLFGKNNFNVVNHILTVLISLNFIYYDKSISNNIESLKNTTLLHYGDNNQHIISGFQLSKLKERMRRDP